MQVVITAVGPDNRGLADPIVHGVTTLGANIAEIQMYDHDAESVFSMLTRIELDRSRYEELRQAMADISQRTELSIRTWSPDIVGRPPRLAICVTYRPETALALLRAIRDGRIKADPRLMIGNRDTCRGLAEQFEIPWFNIAETSGKPNGTPDDDRMIELCDEHEVDFIVLARYMRVLPAASCWKYAGGPDYQSAPRIAAELPRDSAVPRRLCRPHVDLRRHLPFHRARARCRLPNHLPINVHGAARYIAR